MERIKQITPIDDRVYESSCLKWNSIAKPLGSFGLLENAVSRIAAVQGTDSPDISNRAAVIMCADHGVVARGVTQCGSDVTAVCCDAIAEGRSNINAVCRENNIAVYAVDVGIKYSTRSKNIINKKIARGSCDISLGAAMTRPQMEKALITGMDMVMQLKKENTHIIISGEMGIGNTTSASAISSVLLDMPPEQVTGRGAGLDSRGLERKIAVIKQALSINCVNKHDPFDILAKLGGLEIAAMTGLFLGGAVYHIPVIIDGFISSAAAALACRIQPLCGGYMLASHCSREPAAEKLLELCGAEPVIYAGLRLGEGTGGALLIPLLDSALALYRNAHRFDETPIERYVELK